MALAVQSARSVRESPFRESEWDRRLDHLLQDLEGSANFDPNAGHQITGSSLSQSATSYHQSSSTQQQSFYASSSSSTSAGVHQTGAAQVQVRSASQDRAGSSAHPGYGTVLQKSKSTSSIGSGPGGAATDSMLKDLDTALKASTNYIESHRTVQMPNGTQEYHEYRSTSTSGGGNPGRINDFNLERQASHVVGRGNKLPVLTTYSPVPWLRASWERVICS